MEAVTSISRRLFDLCLDGKGRLPESFFFASVVRAGIWIELVKETILGASSSRESLPLLDLAIGLEQGPVLDSGGDWIDNTSFGFDLMLSELLDKEHLSETARPTRLRRGRYETAYVAQREADLQRTPTAREHVSLESSIVAIIGSTGQLVGQRRSSGYGLEPDLIEDDTWTVLRELAPAVQYADEYLRWKKRKDHLVTKIWT